MLPLVPSDEMYDTVKKSNKICSVPTCSVKPGTGISFHKFPKDEKYRLLWARLFHMRVLTINDCVCNYHFEPSCFFRGNIDLASTSTNSRRKLKKDAVPTLKLPDKNYYQTYSARKKELRKIKRIRQWRVKKNKDVENVHPLIKNPPEIDDFEIGIDPLDNEENDDPLDNEENDDPLYNEENDNIHDEIEDGFSDINDESEDDGEEQKHSVVNHDEGISDEAECEIYPLDISELPIDSPQSTDEGSPSQGRKTSGSYCSVPSCNTYGGYNIPLHLFPKDKRFAQKWKEVLKIKKPLSPYLFVCGKHFIPTDYLPTTGQNKKKTLKKIAIPSQKLPTMSPESSKNIQLEVEEAAQDHLKLILQCLPKDPVIKNECLLKLQSVISGLNYTPQIQELKEHTEQSFETVQKRVHVTNTGGLIDLVNEENLVSSKESEDPLESSNPEENSGSEFSENLRSEIENLTAKGDTAKFPAIVKRRVSDQELVRCFLTNATLVKKFLKNEEQLVKYLDTAAEVKRGVSGYVESHNVPLRRTVDKNDPCTVFGDFVANKLRLMTCLENRKQFKDWIHQGLKIIERTS